MTNVPGYALPGAFDETPGLPGLTFVTSTDEVDAEILLGGDVGPGIGGEFWTLPSPPIPAGPTYSDTQVNGMWTYFVSHKMAGPFDETGTSTALAAAAVAAGGNFAMIKMGDIPRASDGVVHFSTTTDPGYKTIEDVSMAGFGGLDTLRGGGFISPLDNSDQKIPHAPFGTLPSPLTYSANGRGGTWTDSRFPLYLLRPTALTWPGQDPDLLSNRLVWATNEIGEVTWRVAGYGGSFQYTPGWFVIGFNETLFPALLPLTSPPPPVDPPSTIVYGPRDHGIIPLG